MIVSVRKVVFLAIISCALVSSVAAQSVEPSQRLQYAQLRLREAVMRLKAFEREAREAEDVVAESCKRTLSELERERDDASARIKRVSKNSLDKELLADAQRAAESAEQRYNVGLAETERRLNDVKRRSAEVRSEYGSDVANAEQAIAVIKSEMSAVKAQAKSKAR